MPHFQIDHGAIKRALTSTHESLRTQRDYLLEKLSQVPGRLETEADRALSQQLLNDLHSLKNQAKKQRLLEQKEFKTALKTVQQVFDEIERPLGDAISDLLKKVNPRPLHLGSQQATQRIKSVRDMLIRRGKYELLTSVVKGKWTKVLDHNRHDVQGMRKLIERAVTDIPH
jgi:hypothetical protein